MKPNQKGEIPVGDEQEIEDVIDYAMAESILEDWDYQSLPDGQDKIEAINKGLQAIRDCIELGLNGYGD